MNKTELIKQALSAVKTAYSPYSGYSVGAALLGGSGKIYTGCNIENASFTPTVCAERVAFFKAVSEGEKKFSAIAVAGGANGICESPFMPCGVCRQVMTEFCEPDFLVIVCCSDGSSTEYTLEQLLPHMFSKKDLKAFG